VSGPFADGPAVRFRPSGARVTVPRGAFLTLAAVRAAAGVVHDCDGQGVCGTCRVEVEAGAEGLSPVEERERSQLGPAVDQGWRLCCLARVYGDVVVRVPEGGFAYPPELQRSGGG
jgi:ferredoxin